MGFLKICQGPEPWQEEPRFRKSGYPTRGYTLGRCQLGFGLKRRVKSIKEY